MTRRDPRPVPSGPYLHGTKADLHPGDRLRPGLVADGEDDDRMRVCADVEFDWALYWAEKRTPPEGTPHDGNPKVYSMRSTSTTRRWTRTCTGLTARSEKTSMP